jgi:tRNA (guanine37-N1)-methyltransferase
LRFDVITLFPQMFGAITDYGVVGRAIAGGLASVGLWNPRDFTSDRHRTVDDRPFGGGPGMLMKMAPLSEAIAAARQASDLPLHSIYLSPQGALLHDAVVRRLAKLPRLLLVAGRYEGIDERLIEAEIDEEWSIGDYVLSGGELAAMVLMDAVIRQLPGALGHAGSAAEDSFADGLLDCPHYTRPECFAGRQVPAVLLSGDHAAIARWRRQQALGRTWQRRPDLLARLSLSSEDQQLLFDYQQQLLMAGESS